MAFGETGLWQQTDCSALLPVYYIKMNSLVEGLSQGHNSLRTFRLFFVLSVIMLSAKQEAVSTIFKSFRYNPVEV